MFRFVGLLLFAHLCRGQNDGGATGDNNSPFVDGGASTEKISLGLNCVTDNDTSTEVRFEFYINQGDADFKFETDATTLRADELIIFETCYFIDYASYDSADKVLSKATAHANCNDEVEFTTLDSSAANTTFEKRTKTATLTIPDPSNNGDYTCGANKNGNAIEVAAYCKIDEGFDKDFDVVFIAEYSTDGCTAEAVSVSTNVGDVPKVNVKYNLEVTMEAYLQPTTPPAGPESLIANKITAPIDLGVPMYLEICLVIPEVNTGATDINNQFFVEKLSAVGVRPFSCTAKPDVANFDFQQAVEDETTWPDIVDSNGCGTATSSSVGYEEYFASDTYIFKWLQDTTNSKGHMVSPNCVKSNSFPAISGARLNAADEVDTLFECQLDVCTSFTDRRCFGDKAGGSDDYPSCPTAGRRKRETITVGPNLPSKASVAIRVKLPGAGTNATNTVNKADECFQRKTFIGITSAMTTLLFAVIIAAILLAVKLGSSEQEKSTDSMTGIHNKAYY